MSNGNNGLDTRYFKYLRCLVNPALKEQRYYQSAVTPNVPREENKYQIENKQDITQLSNNKSTFKIKHSRFRNNRIL